jgi:ubiquinone/menaquinone biosynthesis C-methylase UbiE
LKVGQNLARFCDSEGDGPMRPRAVIRDWVSYEHVVAAYDGALGINGYSRLAEDLIAALGLPRGGVVLDVGCGTGAATRFAQAAVGSRGVSGGISVGLDVSLAMLRHATAKGLERMVAGAVPGLPFRSASFDGVAASLVISHVEAHEAALCDMVRVLKPGGRLGVTAWTSMRRDARSARLGASAVLREVATRFVSPESLDRAFAAAVPREEWFADPAHLSAALACAGLARVEVHERGYPASLATEDYLAMMGAMAIGRFLRHELGAEGWRVFEERALEELRAVIGERVEYTAPAYLAVGSRD